MNKFLLITIFTLGLFNFVYPNDTTTQQAAQSKYFYAKDIVATPVMNDTGDKKIDFMRKFTRVTILEEKTVGEKNPTVYAKVSYNKDRKKLEGWVPKSSLTSSITNIIPEAWNKLEFVEIPKANYPNNPRVVVKGVYVSAGSFASTKTIDRLIELAKNTEINAFVIDVKDDDGFLSWKMPTVTSEFKIESDKRAAVKDINAIMAKLKANNIYTIARIVSFKDPTWAKTFPDKTVLDKRTNKPYSNSDKLPWVSAFDNTLWNYNIAVAKEAARVGFNEIQFDYVRFPASNGGKLDASLDYRNPTGMSKPVAIQKYLLFARKELSPLHVYISADVFGQVGSSYDDMGLGQHWEAVANVVDYICPMVYPSHYANGTYGVAIPDAEPYKTVYGSTRDSVNRNNNISSPAIVRTWIQDFSAKWVKGHITYRTKEVKEQIKALNDLGLQEYILWNAANKYSFENKNPNTATTPAVSTTVQPTNVATTK